MVDPGVAAAEASRTRERRPRRVGDGARRAQGRMSPGAGQAKAATGHEHDDHVVALAEITDTGTHFHDHTRAFVAQRDRGGPRSRTVDDRQVRMAEPRRADPHQHLVLAGRIERDLVDLQGTGRGAGLGGTEAGEDGGKDLHGGSRSGVARKTPPEGRSADVADRGRWRCRAPPRTHGFNRWYISVWSAPFFRSFASRHRSSQAWPRRAGTSSASARRTAMPTSFDMSPRPKPEL